jgi:hypothetical protein
MLTVAASWVMVISNDQPHDLNHVAYLLCANCAGIDVLRLSAREAKKAKDASSEQVTIDAQLRAANIVIWWANLHIIYQYAITFRFREPSRRSHTLVAGWILPLTANGHKEFTYWVGMGSNNFSALPMLSIQLGCTVLIWGWMSWSTRRFDLLA